MKSPLKQAATPNARQKDLRASDAPLETEQVSATRFAICIALLVCGLGITWWLINPEGTVALGTLGELIVVLSLAALAAIPLVNRGWLRLLEMARNPTPRARAWTAAAIWAIALAYLIATAFQQHRDLYPRLHDECSYTLQAKMLAVGRLWFPQHELADFFETFHVLTKPVYASIYFPGTALMNVTGVLLGLPSWVLPVMLAALVVAMTYRVTAELVDGVAGMVAALLLLAVWLFRVHSTMVMAQIPAMLLGILMDWAWLNWRRHRFAGWAAAVGVFAGWAAITRPVEALAFALPIGLAMAWDLRRQPGKTIGRTALLLLAGGAPFLALQGVFDLGVTGKLLKTPYVLYLEENQPGAVFGTSSGQIGRPETQLPQKQIYNAQLAAMEQKSRGGGTLPWLGERARMTARASLPFAAAVLLIPIALLFAQRRQRWVALAAIPLWFALYALNPLFLLHYGLPLAATVAITIATGASAIGQSLPWPAGRRFVDGFLPAALVAMAVCSLPQVNRRVSDEPYRTPLLDYVEKTLAQVSPPAVVFFHFTPGGNVHEEPVYNLQTAWPDDEAIVRVQDLAPARDIEVLQYYAIHQPERTFYVMDRRSGRTYAMGNAVQAAAALHGHLNLPPAPGNPPSH